MCAYNEMLNDREEALYYDMEERRSEVQEFLASSGQETSLQEIIEDLEAAYIFSDTLAYELGLSRLDCFALTRDFDGFKKESIQNRVTLECDFF